MDVGGRIGAILDSDATHVRFLGYGVYEGDFPLEIVEGLTINVPRLKLDSGETVWGAEVWWGPESTIRKELEGKTVENVSIEDLRAAAEREEV